MEINGSVREHTRFDHSAFLYDSDAAYTSTLVTFIRDGLARDESVAVATDHGRIAMLCDALGDDAAAVRFLADDEWYVRPVRTIAGWARMLAASAARGRPSTRLVGQVRFGPEEQHTGWVRCESALNRALARWNGHLMCPYDLRELPSHLIEAAARTHPLICDGGWSASDRYEAPERLLADVVEPPYPVTGDPVVRVPVADTVAGLREKVRHRAEAERWLSPERLDDLVLAVSEVATNCVRHGGGHGELKVWLNTEAVVCEVTDRGTTPPDPLAGYLPPPPGAVGGMGLWLVHQVCDALAIHASGGLTRARFAVRRA
ncbi:MAG TPA: sensor histidine kinase [Actinoplanes sp.]|jgi:anti-sigma regulatory factor (Ser/Thr protein kinase)